MIYVWGVPGCNQLFIWVLSIASTKIVNKTQFRFKTDKVHSRLNFLNSPHLFCGLDFFGRRGLCQQKVRVRMKMENKTEPAQTCFPPDGYGQWNTNPPRAYASWGDYFASISRQACDVYRKNKIPLDGRSSQPCSEN